MVTEHSKIMPDKGYNLANECPERQVELVIPPGRRGQSQMSSKSVQKTSSIAKMRIRSEQVINEINTFAYFHKNFLYLLYLKLLTL